MALSVLNNISAIYAENNLNQTQSNLQNTLTELSSGSRINSGSDDAAGLSVADGLSANEAALTQSSQNASDGVSLLQTADGALSQVNNLLNRAVTLATEASNGTLNANQVSSANAEYQNILTEIGNIGSSTNFNGNSVFSSTATNFVVSDGTTSGTTTFADTVGSLTTSSIGETSPTVTPGSTSAISLTTPTSSTGTATALTAAAGATAVSGTQSALTASTPTTSALGTPSTMTLTGTTGDTVSGQLSIAVGAGSAHSIQVADGSSLAQVAAQINADSTYQANNVSATYNSTTNVLTIAGPATASSDLASTGSTLQQTTAGVAATSTVTLAAAGNTVGGTLSIAVGGGSASTLAITAGSSLSDVATQINADSTYQAENVSAAYNSTTGELTISGPSSGQDSLSTSGSALTQTAPTPGTSSTTTLTLGSTADTVGGTLSIGVGAASAHSITVASGSSLSQVATQINADTTYQSAGVTAAYNSTTGALTISGPESGSSDLATTGTSLTQSTPATTGPAGAGVDFTNASISSLTAASAQTVLTSVTAAIGDVAYQRGIIGANVNELTAASNVASSESENLTAASSAIMSTDYGQATSAMASEQVLSQTGISALAQANSVQQEVLKLLQ